MNRLTDSSSPLDPQLFPESPTPISTIINSQKVGHHYDYFVSWKNSANSENSWLPFFETPSNLYYIRISILLCFFNHTEEKIRISYLNRVFS